MTAVDPGFTPWAEARDAGRGLLAGEPWEPFSTRATLLLTSPPRVEWTIESPEFVAREYVLVLEDSEARRLPASHGALMQAYGVVRWVSDVSERPATILVYSLDGMERMLDGASRLSMETRWALRHSTVAHDPLRRLDGLRAAADRLSDSQPERAARTMYLFALTACAALAASVSPYGTGVDGPNFDAAEAIAAVARLTCFLEEGSYPPVQWLVPHARVTGLGSRFEHWVEAASRAVGGGASDELGELTVRVHEEIRAAVRAEFGRSEWFQHPWEHALRPPR